MRSGYRYIFLCAAFLISLQKVRSANTAADSSRVVGMERVADSLRDAGKYYEASLAYEKAIYFNTSAQSKAGISLKRAQTLKQVGSYDIAEQTLNRVDLSAVSDSVFYEVKYNAALCAYLNADFAGAESHIIQLIYFAKDKSRSVQSFPLYTLILNESDKYDTARVYIEKYINEVYSNDEVSRTAFLNETKNLYDKKNRPVLKRMKKARLMSFIIPGMGQMYAGFWGEGLTAMACNAVFIGLTGVGIYYQYYITSILYSYSIFSKFYVGNIKRVEFLVNKKNYQLQKNYREKLKERVVTYWK